MEIKPLQTKIRDLPDTQRKIIRSLIRAHCEVNNIYAETHQKGIGLEETEEAIEHLLDKGLLRIIYSKQDETLNIVAIE